MADSSTSTLLETDDGHKLNVLHLKCPGDSCETTFFFIHGSMGSLSQFDDMINLYKSKVNVVAYDVMGCGSSEKPFAEAAYSTKLLTSNSIQVFEKFASAKNVLIGHSYGTAQIARLCSHIHRKRDVGDAQNLPVRTICGVILLGTVEALPESMSSIYRLFSLPLCLLSPMQGWMSRSYVSMAFSPSSNSSLREKAITTAGKNKMYVCKAFYRQFEWATHEDWVATSQYPVLICHGDDDKVTSLEGAQALLKLLLSQQDSKDASKNKVGRSPDLIPVCSKDAQSDINGLIHTPDKNRFQMVMISHAGHQLLEEQPSQIVDQMNRFLADICGLIIAH